MKHKNKNPEPLEDQLKREFNFTKDDLIANQQGCMGKNQHYWLVDRLLRRLFANLGITLLIGFFVVTFFRNTEVMPMGTIWIIGMVIAMIAYFIYTIHTFWQMLVDTILWKVDRIEGVGRVYEGYKNRNKSYTLEIRDCSFELTKPAYKILIPELYYTVYYAPRSKVILAIEVE